MEDALFKENLFPIRDDATPGHAVLIDPFTVFVQVLNFIILILILKRFLFGPITRAIAAREQKIATALHEARENDAHARKKLEEIQARTIELTAGEAELLRKARERADTLEKNLIHEAKATARTKQEQLSHALDKEKIQRLNDLQRELAGHVYKATDQALRDLAGPSLQTRIVECFLDKLDHEINGEEKEFIAAFRPDSSLTVTTADTLNNQAKERLTTLLAQKFSFQGTIDFEMDQELVAGMVISGNGRKIAWTIEKYLKDLKNGLMNQEDPA